MKRFALIGYPLGHSYSQRFFQRKFKQLGLKDHIYDVFEMESLSEFPLLWSKHGDLYGVNVTIPHKKNVIQYLDKQDISSVKVGATNVIHKKAGKLIGYNTDYMAFKESLSNWTGVLKGEALILGTGGASEAVQVALSDLHIPSHRVSRRSGVGDLTYEQIRDYPEIIRRYLLIVNTTPLGMYPKEVSYPKIPYHYIEKDHFLYDLVYNPEETVFLKKGRHMGAKTKNGLEMLELQAEKSWDVWSNN